MNYRILFIMIWLVTGTGFAPVPHSSALPCINKTRCPNRATSANLSSTSFPGGPLQINAYDDGSLGLQQNGINQFYGERASGVFLWAGGSAWGPTVPAGSALPAFTLVNQGVLTGNGTASDPYAVTTVFSVGSTGLVLTQHVKYVIGSPSLSFNWTLQNNGPTQGVSLFHAADLYVDGNDSGGGFFDINNQTVGGENIQSQAYGLFTPITPANAYEEAGYSTIWSRISSDYNGAPGSGLLDRIEPNYIDNGAGLQWNMPQLATGASIQISDQFSLTSVPGSGGTGDQLPPTSVETMPDLREFEFGTQVAASPSAYSSNNITFNLPITRYYGGQSNIAPMAHLTLDAFGVDSPNEVDTVEVGSCTVGQLTGHHNSWQTVTFDFHSSCLNFPSLPINLADPRYDTEAISAQLVPSANQITVLVDTQHRGYKALVAWATLYVGGVRPVLFSHGLDPDCQNGENRQLGQWSQYLQSDGIPALGNRNDGSKSIETQYASMDTTYEEMRRLFGLRQQSVGVAETDKIILVGHSMGGLTARYFTSIYGSDTVANFATFGTPNDGANFGTLGAAFKPCSRGATSQLIPWYVRYVFNPSFSLQDTWQSPSNHITSVGARLSFLDDWDWVVSNASSWALSYDTDNTYTYNDDRYSYEQPYPFVPNYFANDGLLHNRMTSLRSMYDRIKEYGQIGVVFSNPPSVLSRPTSRPPARHITPRTPQQAVDNQTPVTQALVTLIPGTTQSVVFPVDTAGQLTTLIQSISTDGITFSLRSPTGRIYSSPSDYASIVNPPTGQWTGQFTATSSLTQTTAISYAPVLSSTLSLSTQSDPFYLPLGQTGTFSILLQDGGTALSGASVAGTLMSPSGVASTVTFTEVGGSPGTYITSYAASELGTYQLDVQVNGTRGDGTLFRRESLVTSTGITGQSLMSDDSDVTWSTTDVNGDGLTDVLSATVQVDVPQTGTYTLSGSLGTATQPSQITASRTISLTAGNNNIILPFDGKAIGQLPNPDTYFLQNVRLLQSGNQIIDERDQFNNFISLDPSSFQHNLLVGGIISGDPLDTNNSGRFNQLLFTAAITATRSGNFKLRATLADSNNQPFLFAEQGMVLNAGANSVAIPFNGDDIAAHGVSGPFTLSDLVVTPLDPGFGNQQLRLTNSFTTAPLNVADFIQQVQLTVTTNLASTDGYVQVTPVSADGRYAQGTQLQLHPVFSSAPPSSWSWSVDNGTEITTPTLSLTMDTSHQVRLTIQQGPTPTSTSTATSTPTSTPTSTSTPTPTSTPENRSVFLPLVLRKY